jgi:hypothetical protein
MNRFFEAIKALFPFSRAFNLTYDSNKRNMMLAISELPIDIRKEIELAYYDLFPYSTRAIKKWSDIFAIVFGGKEVQKQRDIIQACWRLHLKGQSESFMEYILQHLDERIRVIENNPVSNPRQSNIGMMAVNGNKHMVNGHRYAVNGFYLGEKDFPPYVIRNNLSELYTIPNDKIWWYNCFFFFFCVVRNNIQEILFVEPIKMSIVWKNFLELLVLKMKPVHTTAIIFIDWIKD